jgi:sarcosine oxidase
MRPRFDVIVAGLGAVGSAAAWQLARRGVRVAGFDRYRPPHAFGSASGRTRIIREAYWEGPFYVPLVQRAYELWAELEQATGRQVLRPTGGLVIGTEKGTLVPGALRSAEAYGIPCRQLTAAEVRAQYPFRPGDAMGAVFEPRAGVLYADDAITAMLGEAALRGAVLTFDQPLESWSAGSDGVVVHTGAGSVAARCLILATGPWMTSALLGLPAPLTVTRQLMFWLRPRDSTAFLPSVCPVWIWETEPGPVYYGFPDLGDGPKIARHHGGEVTTAETVRRDVAPDEATDVLSFVERAIPPLCGPVTDARVCLYTNTPDSHFVVDRHPHHPEVLIASPCSGHGFKFAPVLGEILADLAMERHPRFDLTPFRIGRFG